MKKEEYLKDIDIFFGKCKMISIIKTKMYGASTIGELGNKGEFVQIHRKYTRLKKMLWKDSGIKNKKALEDTLIDMANYCAMVYSCMKRDVLK